MPYAPSPSRPSQKIAVASAAAAWGKDRRKRKHPKQVPDEASTERYERNLKWFMEYMEDDSYSLAQMQEQVAYFNGEGGEKSFAKVFEVLIAFDKLSSVEELRAIVEHLSDQDLQKLSTFSHDFANFVHRSELEVYGESAEALSRIAQHLLQYDVKDRAKADFPDMRGSIHTMLAAVRKSR